MSYLISAIIGLAVSYALYIPLPAENYLDRVKIQIQELIMRFLYFYPMNALKIFGITWQVWWARKSLGILIRLLRYKAFFRRNGGVKVSKESFDHVPVLIYEPKTRKSDAAIVLIHGGGFVLMDADSYDQLARKLAAEAGVVIFNIDYRVAPEHRFPTALDDCDTAISHLLNAAYAKYAINPDRVAIMGDSAGGNLAAGSAYRLMARSTQVAKPKLQILLYPLLQFIDFQTISYREATILYGGSAFADPESIARWVALYVGLSGKESAIFLKNAHVKKDAILKLAPHVVEEMHHTSLPFRLTDPYEKKLQSRKSRRYGRNIFTADVDANCCDIAQLHEKLEPILFDPELSPLMRRDLSLTPKTYLVTCHYDPLRDEGYWYNEKLKKFNVDVTWRHYENGFHAIINLHDELDLAAKIFDDLVAFIDEHL